MKSEGVSKHIEFSVNYFPENFRFDFERFLYNEPDFLQLQKPEQLFYFYILHYKKKRILGRIVFSIVNEEGHSSHKSPFGGLEINPSVDLAVVDAFIEFFYTELKRKGIKSVLLKQAPFAFSEIVAAKATNSLLRSGYEITNPDLNHHITVDNLSLEGKIHPMEKRKLRKAKTKGFTFQEEAVVNLKLVYDFICLHRKEKEQSLNISFDDLERTFQFLPEYYKIFSVKHKGEIIAVTIIVLLNRRIVYNFLPASSTAYNMWSPMVYLLANIYQYCFDNKVEIIDLGISSLNNVPQYSLTDFKERIGGKSSLKCTFKVIDHWKD